MNENKVKKLIYNKYLKNIIKNTKQKILNKHELLQNTLISHKSFNRKMIFYSNIVYCFIKLHTLSNKIINYFSNSVVIINNCSRIFFKYCNFPNSLKIIKLCNTYNYLHEKNYNKKMIFKKIPLKLIIIDINMTLSKWCRILSECGNIKYYKLLIISHEKNKIITNNFDKSLLHLEKNTIKIELKENI